MRARDYNTRRKFKCQLCQEFARDTYPPVLGQTSWPNSGFNVSRMSSYLHQIWILSIPCLQEAQADNETSSHKAD